jgi:DNA repair protein RadD
VRILGDAVSPRQRSGRGIVDGWLSPLSSKATLTTIDVRGVHKPGGEFIAGELEAAADVETIVAAACDEIITRGADRKCWLIFCCGISHAEHVRDALRARGVSCDAVFGETQDERERIIADFRAGRIKCLVNVMVLTTGFDVPQIDMLVMLRPTLSTGLYVQMVGRGTRKRRGRPIAWSSISRRTSTDMVQSITLSSRPMGRITSTRPA